MREGPIANFQKGRGNPAFLFSPFISDSGFLCLYLPDEPPVTRPPG